MFEIKLAGCTPEPLMNYLKALGVFRLVAEQADPQVRLSWRGGVATLHTKKDEEALLRFFLDEYRPTPIVAPWGARSGFYPGSPEKSARDALDAIVAASTTTPRLSLFCDVIQSVRSLLSRHGFDEKAKDEDKIALMRLCRNELADQVVPWLDAVFVLTEDHRRFPPLLGTGGNEGSGSYVSTYSQVVEQLLVRRSCDEGLKSSLLREFSASSGDVAVGHFNPGAIGGPNSSQGYSGGGGVNPWDYLLAIEGTLIFAGAAARRYDVLGRGRADFPFCVDAVAVGYATDSSKEAAETRAEMWLPIWSSQSSFNEVKQLFAEGRSQLGRNKANNAVEFSIALSTYGVSRGLDGFVRYGFAKRNGLNFFAAPLGLIAVTHRAGASRLKESGLLTWIDSLRRACSDKDKTPARYQSALRDIDRAMFAFANRSEQGNDATYLVDVFRAIGRAERTLALAGLSWLKDKQYGWKVHPLSGLSPDWLKQANDDSPEFRLAASLAGIVGAKNGNSQIAPLREFIEPVEVTKYVNWHPDSTAAVWSQRSVTANLAGVFRRRQMEAHRAGFHSVPLDTTVYASLSDVSAYLNGETDDEKLHDLIWGILCVKTPAETLRPERHKTEMPFEFCVPRLLLNEANYAVQAERWVRSNDAPNVKPHPDVFHALSTGRPSAVGDCVDLAARRLKAGGLLVHGYRNRPQAGQSLAIQSQFSAERLLSAMLFPLSDHDLVQIASSVLYPPESAE